MNFKCQISNIKFQINNIPCFLEEVFPFIFGKEINNHVMVNNWENGWNMDGVTGNNFIIVYLPQYLEYIGFLLGFITILYSLLGVVRGNGRWIKPRHIDKSNSPTKPDIPEEPNATTSTPTHTMESLQKELRDLTQESVPTSSQQEPKQPQQQSTKEQDSRDTMHRAPTTENQDTNKPFEPNEKQEIPVKKSAPIHEEIILKTPNASSKPETSTPDSTSQTSTPSTSPTSSINSAQANSHTAVNVPQQPISKEAQLMHKRHHDRQQHHKQTKPSHPSHHKSQPLRPAQGLRPSQPQKSAHQQSKPTHNEEKNPEQKEETVFDLSKNQE